MGPTGLGNIFPANDRVAGGKGGALLPPFPLVLWPSRSGPGSRPQWRDLWLGGALACLMAALPPGPAQAVDLIWSEGDPTPGFPFTPGDGDWSVTAGQPNWWRADGAGADTFDQDDAVQFANDGAGATVTVRLVDAVRVSAMSFLRGNMAVTATGAGTLTGAPGADLTVAAGAVGSLAAPLTGAFDLEVGGTFALTTEGSAISAITVLTGGDLTLTTPQGRRLVVAGGTVNDGRMTLTDGSTLQSRVDSRTWMTLVGATAIDGAVRNGPGALIRLSGTTRLGDGSAAALINEGRFAAIAAGVGADVTIAGTLENTATGLLDGVGQPLRLRADRIVLRFGNRVSGDVQMIAGSVLNEGRLDMAVMPTLGGRVENAATGSLIVGGVVDGAGHDIANTGSLTVTGTGVLTGLGRLDNGGAVTIEAGAQVSAVRLWHQGGTLVSRGSLTGRVDLDADADLSGSVTGPLRVGAGTTRITGALAVDGGGGSPDLTVAVPGRVEIAAGQTLTAPQVQVDGALALGGGAAGVAGDVTVAGTLEGQGRIDGTLTLTGAARVLAGGAVTVRDRVVTALTTPTLWSDLGTVIAGSLENRGILTLDRSFAGPVVNESGGTLEVGADLTGPLTSRSTTRLGQSGGSVVLQGGVTIAGGTTRVFGATRVTGPAALRIDAPGTLRAEAGDLEAEGGVEARGNLVVGEGHVLTTPRLIVGDAAPGAAGATTLAGTVAGTVDVRADGRLTLDGGEITGRLTNAGTLTSAASPGTGPITLRAGLVNSGTATLGLAGNAARVSGDVTNTGTADLTAVVTGRLDNDGTLTAAGRAQSLENRGVATVGAGRTLVLDNGAANAAGGRLTVAGRLDGTLANAAGAQAEIVANGRVTKLATNDGSLTLAGHAAGGIDNRTGAQLRVTGIDATVTGGIDNRTGAAVTLAPGARLTGDLRNAAGGTVTATGTIVGEVRNDGTLRLSDNLRVDGTLTNRGLLTQTATGTTLTVNGTLRQMGSIRTGVGGAMTVAADTIEVWGQSTVGAGVRLVGRVLLNGDISYDSDQVLYGDLGVATGGSLSVTARLDGQGTADLGNRGSVTIGSQGALVGMGDMTNRKDMTIDGRVAGDRLINGAGATLVNRGTIDADVSNAAGASVLSSGEIKGDLVNTGTVQLTGGQVAGRVSNAGGLTVSGNLSLGGDLANIGRTQISAGTTRVVDVSNDGTFSIGKGAELVATGRVVTTGDLEVEGRMTGELDNRGKATFATRLTGTAVNGAGGTLTLAQGATGALTNAGEASIAGAFGRPIVNAATGRLIVTDDVTADRIDSQGGVTLGSGTTTILREGMTAGGGSATVIAGGATLRGHLINNGTTGLAGRIEGQVANQSGLLVTAPSQRGAVIQGGLTNGPSTAQVSPPPGGTPVVQSGTPLVHVLGTHRLTVTGGTLNGGDARILVDGTLVSDLRNLGDLTVRGRVEGMVTTSGSTSVAGGTISGNLVYRGGTLSMTNGGRVVGALSMESDLRVNRGTAIDATRVVMGTGTTLSVAGGTVAGDVSNAAGRVALSGGAVLRDDLRNGAGATLTAAGANRIEGALVNDGTVDLRNKRAGDVLRLGGGLSGRGVYALDLDLNTRDGGSGGDRIMVTGGGVTGHVRLTFDVTDLPAGPVSGRPITVLDVSGATGPVRFTYDSQGLPTANEKIVYALVQDKVTGNLDLTYGTNASISGLSGNIVLTQSLIGSVVNRPTSPFVTGYALAEGEAPCAPGAWARATGGRADATGSSATSGPAGYRVNSAISARYTGLQFGGDLACFDGHFNGWNMAFGVIGGVNDGSTRQPVYLLDNVGGGWQQTDTLGSINTADFRQLYGGVYVTATRDRLSADLQLRREQTAFTLNNTPVIADSAGLGITNAKFDSNAVTLSGSLSYAFPLGDKGLQVVPTAGFALSRVTTDPIVFDQGERLEIRDTTNRVGFLGATLSRGKVLASGTEAVNFYATGTIYHDFAGGTQSDFIIPGDTEGSEQLRERLTSDNLGTYGEIGLGASYTRVLQPGSAGKPRQISGSVRLDGRSGASLDSYGLTAQLRLQF